MFADLWLSLKELLASKKFQATVAGVILAVAAKYGLHFDPDITNQIVALIIAYVVGQGIADRGKAAAKIEAVSAQAQSGDVKAQSAVNKMAEETK